MKLYTNNQIDGHYPVGACIIALAENKEEAKVLMEEECTVAGLPQIINIDDIEEVPMILPKAIILIEGDY